MFEQRANGGENVRLLAKDLGITCYTDVYEWVHFWRRGGTLALMTKREKKELVSFTTIHQMKVCLPDDKEELKDLAVRLIAEKAVLEEELRLSKKLRGGIPERMPPRLKSRIVLNLRDSLPLALLFLVMGLRSSSSYYSRNAAGKPDKYAQVREQIHEISVESGCTYGSPRIWMVLRREGTIISEKVVRRLMKEEEITVHFATRRRYTNSSYVGEVSPAPGNLVHGNFHATAPNR